MGAYWHGLGETLLARFGGTTSQVGRVARFLDRRLCLIL